MKYSNFEELPIWEIGRRIVNRIYKITRKYAQLQADKRFVSQLTSSVVSIMNNIAEGFDSDNNREFTRFLKYSQRSCSEVMSMCYVLKDNFENIAEADQLYDLCLEERKQIKGFIKYIKSVE